MFEMQDVKYISIIDIKSLRIPAEKITCLIGKSGGGKTTLLKMLNKLISPTSGTIMYKDQLLNTLDSVKHRQEVAYLTQKPFVYKGTIKDNLLKGLSFHKKTVSDEALIESLKKVKLDKELLNDSSTLSGGEAQRLALARVMILDAEVYLMDEPSSALDTQTEEEVIEAIVTFVKEKNKTLVMITHSEAVARKVADQIVTIEKGQIKECVNCG